MSSSGSCNPLAEFGESVEKGQLKKWKIKGLGFRKHFCWNLAEEARNLDAKGSAATAFEIAKDARHEFGMILEDVASRQDELVLLEPFDDIRIIEDIDANDGMHELAFTRHQADVVQTAFLKQPVECRHKDTSLYQDQ